MVIMIGSITNNNSCLNSPSKAKITLVNSNILLWFTKKQKETSGIPPTGIVQIDVFHVYSASSSSSSFFYYYYDQVSELILWDHIFIIGPTLCIGLLVGLFVSLPRNWTHSNSDTVKILLDFFRNLKISYSLKYLFDLIVIFDMITFILCGTCEAEDYPRNWGT